MGSSSSSMLGEWQREEMIEVGKGTRLLDGSSVNDET